MKIEAILITKVHKIPNETLNSTIRKLLYIRVLNDLTLAAFVCVYILKKLFK